jgi:alkaline phosphatase D
VKLTRRQFLEAALALCAGAMWVDGAPRASTLRWQERRELYPQGVASGDPQAESVILWTRYVASRPWAAPTEAAPTELTVEVALDQEFQKVVATTTAPISEAADWTCRILVGNLRPATVYWYRFTDAQGNGSRIGRTITAPGNRDSRPVKFAFVSCQTINEGSMNAYRRMLHEDRRAAEGERLGFVLHLGDFIYEVVQYTDEVKTRYDRVIFDIGRVPDARKVGNFHIPTTLEGYRVVYQAYLKDPDIQDARAWLPFVAMWDNHEFSWQAWQSFIKFGAGEPEPAQALKVAAMQAWFEYQPARIVKSGGPSLERFDGPNVVSAPITTFDESGLGTEPNNLAAINSLIGYRALRYGRNVELLITDNRGFAMQDQGSRKETDPLALEGFAGMIPEEVIEILDAGRTYAGSVAAMGRSHNGPPDKIRMGDTEIDNFRKNSQPWTILGEKQRAWFIERLKRSQATWKVWGSSMATLDYRFDPQHLPDGLAKRKWPGAGYANRGGGDFGAAYWERGQIYDTIAREKITGFVSVCGDRHSFWAGYAAKALPPKAFEPVGLAFVTGSISAPGMVEAYEHRFPKDDPLRPLFLADLPGNAGAGGAKPEPTVNMTLRHGVRASLEYARSRDIAKARALSNPDNAPHLAFVDMGGHGYSTVRASKSDIETEFVCIPRPIHRSQTEDGGPLLYRVTHRAALWKARERPRLEQKVMEGDPKLSL